MHHSIDNRFGPSRHCIDIGGALTVQELYIGALRISAGKSKCHILVKILVQPDSGESIGGASNQCCSHGWCEMCQDKSGALVHW